MINSIEVDRVSKRFVVNAQRATDLREKLSRWARPRPEDHAEFWALQDVSFNVGPGTSLGIVGHNGSGKSTMLKLLTGIMKPTCGAIRTRGRIGSLIEVGAGFHPELTGRENIYLNGSLLSLSRQEIASKFDAIVDFAGLEQFVETPVKRYSSGMFMRLGFSIAIHIDPDILVIDEALAVGDTQFQNKCLRRMKEFMTQGGTLVFVSHAMGQVAELCQQCVWLDHGKLLYYGETEEAVDRYMALVADREDEEFKRNHPKEWAIREAERLRAEEERRQAEEELRRAEEERIRAEEEAKRRQAEEEADPNRSRLLGITLLDADGQARTHFRAGEAMTVRIAYRFARPRANAIIGFQIYRDDGLYMFAASNYQYDLTLSHLPLQGEIEFFVPFLSLNEGAYRFRLSLFPEPTEEGWDLRPEHVIENAVTFTVSAGPLAHGCAFLPVEWKVGSLPPLVAATPSRVGANER
jgi:ABC-type polysaccharide/polyol phosphate transport system ATPase subunit